MVLFNYEQEFQIMKVTHHPSTTIGHKLNMVKVKEELPKDMPIPWGKMMHTTTYADANLMHDLVTG
jgi:hypothetical protein